jgi:glutamate/tyrosine decarboxylase-like PLP-dependent enzyme
VHWPKKSREEIERAVFDALDHNASYARGKVLGYPGSFLDREVFPDAPFVRSKPFLSCLRANPNHIGCHTLGPSEAAFEGTQRLELDLLRICAEEILRVPAGGYDGYVASGGTECNVQALWVQRNLLRDVHGAGSDQILVLCSEDTHYSVPKAADLLSLRLARLPVDRETRQIDSDALRRTVLAEREAGRRFFVLVLNMGTTIFGSVDDIARVRGVLDPLGADWRVHVDAAFGGFIYPFTNERNALDFADPRVVSATLDGHKMLQAPYGTGIFLARKGQMPHVCTADAKYVRGMDYTLTGSRSGSNPVAMWMILSSYGSEGGRAFVRELVARTDRFCGRLMELGIRFFRDPYMNIVALDARQVPPAVAEQFLLVPDSHDAPAWWKVVVMDHVHNEHLESFLAALRG